MSITGDNYNYRSTNFVDQDEPNGLVPGEQRRYSDDITANNHSRDTCHEFKKYFELNKNEFKEYFASKRQQTSSGTGLTKTTDFFIVTKNTNLQ